MHPTGFISARALDWLHRIARRSDSVAAILVALVILMMVLPFPTPVIDFAIAVNISMAVLLIALALYLPNAAAFSSFPVVLLLTTLFRLGIEISTSRSILTRADAGAIVETFGRFVAEDNVVVGAIVFLIIAVVQFVVVTKGAERVAEVAARFSLDSMPGRQMAIDADLRAGIARPETAQCLRAELARESRMHGAMDGAMKFVKGDAIAGFVIVIVNLLAGVAIGVVQHDMALGDALQRYCVLTIGNGLVAQIPALLISIAAAILTTRGEGDGAAGGTTVGKQIVDEARAAPVAWLAAGAVSTMFAAVPGMPWPAFLALSAPMLAFGVIRLRREAAARARGPEPPNPDAPIPDRHDLRQIVPIRPIVVSVSPQVAGDARFDALVRAARRARNEIVMRYGMTVPNIEVEHTARLDDDAYEIAIHEVVAAAGRFHWTYLCVPARAAAALGEATRAQAVPQSYALVGGAAWFSQAALAGCDEAMATGMSQADYFARLVAQLLHRHAAQFVGIHEAQLLLNWLQREIPAAAKELSQAVSVPRFAEILRLLVSERVSVRNVRQIVETLVSWAPLEKDTAMLVEHVRLALQAQICQEFAREGALHALVVDHPLEERMRSSLQQTARGWSLVLDHDTACAVQREAGRLAAPHAERGVMPVVLTTQDLRRPLRVLLQDALFDVYVLSYAELTPTQRVHSLGSIALAGD